MTRDFLDIHGNYAVKILIIVLLIFGLKGIKIIKKNKKTDLGFGKTK
jgi:hypothetical protein